MSTFDRIWSGLRSIVQMEADLARLSVHIAQIDNRERETRERLIYLEGVIAGARTRAADRREIASRPE